MEDMVYGQCVAYLTVAHVNLEKAFSSIFTLLPNLQGVQFHKNHLLSLEGVGQAKHLRTLVVGGNEISELPLELTDLKASLRKLVICDNPIAKLPDFILELKKLNHLDFGNTLISELPAEIGELTNLKHLEMKRTMVHKLPDSFHKLKVRFLSLPSGFLELSLVHIIVNWLS